MDAFVTVAILAGEPGWEDYAKAINAGRECFTSPVAFLEVVMVLSSASARNPTEVERIVQQFLASHNIRMLAIGAETASSAIAAFERFGKGRHPARLNLGDCFS